MITKEELINTTAANTRREYLYSILKLSALFFLIGLLASYFGLTSMSTDLQFVSNNTFVAHVTFIGFIIAANERIIEAFKRTFRRRTSQEYYNEMEQAQKASDETPEDAELKLKARYWQSINNDYSSETGRMCLTASLSIGCILSCLGVVRVLGGLEDTTQFSSTLHVMLFDAVDVVFTGWLIAGGSEGWTGFLTKFQQFSGGKSKLN